MIVRSSKINQMRTLICTSPGKFEYRDTPIPEVANGYTLLKIRRIGICGTDLHAYEGTQPFFSYPRILGHELAAEVVQSPGGYGFEEGELVTIIPYFNCGKCIACVNGKPNCCVSMQVSGVHIDGGMREYLSVPSYSLVHGDGLGADALALIEPLAIGAHAVRRAALVPGEFALVVGAGPIGLGIMEFAKMAGAHVIALDLNEDRLAFARENLNIPFTIHALKQHVAAQLAVITNGNMPTAVFDATGNLKAMNDSFSYIAHGGRYVLVGLQKEFITFSHPEFHKREATLMSSRNATRQDFDHVIASIRKGTIQPDTYITDRVMFEDAATAFPKWLGGESGLVKAVMSI
jgi:2-desacetyl-2-hydroxyethyl bacteriochlorophyllide A dehydrogenase